MNDLFIILFLIVLNGVFSMSEIALISAKKSRLSNDAKRGSTAAKAAIELAEEPERFLSTVQIGITLIGILTGIYSGDALADDSIDNMLGMVYLKDLAIILYKKYFCLGHILRPATFYPKNTSVYTMLEAMRKGSETRAIVCDEFGGTSGIVTLRDILEGLVGALDERTEEADIVERQDGLGWLVDGQCPIYDFLAYFDREFLYKKREYTTVSGIILNKLERIPQSGEYIEWEGFRLEIVDMDGIRIDKVLVTKME